MDWKQLLLTHRGRIGRRHFWIAQLIMFIASFLVAVVMAFGFEMLGSPIDDGSAAGRVLETVIRLLFVYPAFCVSAKRLHDLDRSAWWQAALVGVLVGYIVIAGALGATGVGRMVVGLLAVLLLIGFVALGFWIGFAPGTPGSNRYGLPDSGARKLAPLADVFS